MSPVVTQRTGALCSDEINVQFVRDVSDVVQNTEADLLVREASKIEVDVRLDLEERIAQLDCLVEKGQELLVAAGFGYAWLDDCYIITHAG